MFVADYCCRALFSLHNCAVYLRHSCLSGTDKSRTSYAARMSVHGRNIPNDVAITEYENSIASGIALVHAEYAVQSSRYTGCSLDNNTREVPVKVPLPSLAGGMIQSEFSFEAGGVIVPPPHPTIIRRSVKQSAARYPFLPRERTDVYVGPLSQVSSDLRDKSPLHQGKIQCVQSPIKQCYYYSGIRLPDDGQCTERY